MGSEVQNERCLELGWCSAMRRNLLLYCGGGKKEREREREQKMERRHGGKEIIIVNLISVEY